MLKTVLTILGVLTLLLIALIGYAACVAAGREDRAMEHLYPLHFFPQIPHRHESRLAGRTRMMIVGFVSGFSISTFSTTIRLTPAMNFAKLEIVTGLFS